MIFNMETPQCFPELIKALEGSAEFDEANIE